MVEGNGAAGARRRRLLSSGAGGEEWLQNTGRRRLLQVSHGISALRMHESNALLPQCTLTCKGQGG